MNQLSPKAIWLFFLPSLLTMIVASPGFLFLIAEYYLETSGRFLGGQQILLLLFYINAPFLVLSYALARFEYRSYFYKLNDDYYYQEQGIFSKKYFFIPYNRIQNINLYRSVLHRLLGLSDLHIETAGSILPDVVVPALSKEDAEKLRNELLRRARSINDGL